jgi:hypothetical protein
MMRDGPEETVVTSMVEVIEVGESARQKLARSAGASPAQVRL